MTDKTIQLPMTAISRDVIHFVTQEFPAGASRKILDAYAAMRQLPESVTHAGKAYPVKEMFYDWFLNKQTPTN